MLLSKEGVSGELLQPLKHVLLLVVDASLLEVDLPRPQPLFLPAERLHT